MWVILCRLPEKGRKEMKEILEEIKKEGQGRKKSRNVSKETEEIKKHSPSTLTSCKNSTPYPTVSQYQLDAPAT